MTKMTKKTKPRRAMSKLKKSIGTMEKQYVAVVLMVDSERTRSTYATADDAFAHAQSKIGELARTQGKRLKFAICKVVEIVEATTPVVDRRAPRQGDGTPVERLVDKYGEMNWREKKVLPDPRIPPRLWGFDCCGQTKRK